MLEALKIAGAFLGCIAFFWRLYEINKSWLHAPIEINKSDNKNGLYIRTKIDNKSTVVKKLDAVFLLISPAGETPDHTVQALVQANAISIDEFKNQNEMTHGIMNYITK